MDGGLCVSVVLASVRLRAAELLAVQKTGTIASASRKLPARNLYKTPKYCSA